MEQNESTISLASHQGSDWDIVEQFVIDNGYEPKHTSLDTYIGRVISCYYDDLECYGMEDTELPIREWVRTVGDLLGQNIAMEDFDYE